MKGIEQLECVYYPGPIPSNGAVLTVLCLVFDRIHFPGVYLPKGDYDKKLLRQEIERLEGIGDRSYDTYLLIGALKFLEYRLPLDGILVYPTDGDLILRNNDSERGKLARAIYDAHFAPRENFHPTFSTGSTKQLPESQEEVTYAGEFFYQAGALAYAAQHRLPILDDGSGLQLPFKARYKDNAAALAGLLALETTGMSLPDIAPMSTQELVDFRLENAHELHAFRAAMLRYAKSLNAVLSEDSSAEEVQRKAKFLIETEVSPALHDLKRDLANPNRPWAKRMQEGVKIASSIALAFVSGGLLGKTAAEGVSSAALAELDARADKETSAKRNGLYYLLKAATVRE